MVIQRIDSVSFPMKKERDFSFLSRYGSVFCVFSQNDSGNISFGIDSGAEKYFVKIAGADTSESCTTPQKAIETLKAAMPIYTDLAHPSLIELADHFAIDGLYVAVFKWAVGDCLFDYWNFEQYDRESISSPGERFWALSSGKKLRAFHTIFDFLTHTESRGYVAVDFYDGSILYDFERDITTICDIDFFLKRPAVNSMGENFWGTKRLKAPEEYTYGAAIDCATNVFTLGALLFHFFGGYTDDEIDRMYRENAFFPCNRKTWQLSEALYGIALKAANPDRSRRYASMKAFREDWKSNTTT